MGKKREGESWGDKVPEAKAMACTGRAGAVSLSTGLDACTLSGTSICKVSLQGIDLVPELAPCLERAGNVTIVSLVVAIDGVPREWGRDVSMPGHTTLRPGDCSHALYTRIVYAALMPVLWYIVSFLPFVLTHRSGRDDSIIFIIFQSVLKYQIHVRVFLPIFHRWNRNNNNSFHF